MPDQISVTEYRKLARKSKGKGRIHSESQLQAECFKWFRYRFPNHASRFFAIPNGGLRNKVVAAKLKAQGVTAGVWDAFIAVPRGAYGGMFVEFKVGRNKLTDEQVRFCDAISTGYRCAICYSFDEFKKFTEEYLNAKNER